MTTDQSNMLDHVVLVLFENRSLDNVLGRLYGPGHGKTSEGVIGKDLSNPIPEWAEHGAQRKVVHARPSQVIPFLRLISGRLRPAARPAGPSREATS